MAFGLWGLGIALAFVVSLVGTWLVRKIALSQGVVDMPGRRRSHDRPTPRGGGAAMLLAFILGWVFTIWRDGGPAFPEIWAVCLGAVAMGFLGMLDDLFRLSVAVRLVVQGLVAGIVVWAGLRFELLWLPIWGDIPLGVWAFPLTMAVLVGLTNFYNFMDGIDGLAAGQGLLTALFLAGAAFLTQQPALAWACLLVAAACAGFLLFNFPPASIFMGDSGSLFLGFFFAAMGLALARGEPQPFPFVLTLLILGNFVFDAGYTLLRRIKHRETLYRAHRGHFYQRLNILGWSHRAITLRQYLLALMLGSSALLALLLGPLVQILLLSGWLVVFLVLAGIVTRMETTRKNRT